MLITLLGGTPYATAACTDGNGNTEMMDAYAFIVNANGFLCATLNKICSTAEPNVLFLECQETRRGPPSRVGYLYNSKTGQVFNPLKHDPETFHKGK